MGGIYNIITAQVLVIGGETKPIAADYKQGHNSY